MDNHKLYVHDALITDKNARELFIHLKTDVLENVPHSTKEMLATGSFGKCWVYYSMVNCFVSIWTNVISLLYITT